MTRTVPEITPHQAAGLFESGAAVQVLDVRTPERVSAGTVELAPAGMFFNITGSMAVVPANLEAAGIRKDIQVIVVCGHGNDSRTVAARLLALGYDARSMTGGMAAWMDVVIPRELPPTRSLDRLVQFDRPGKGSLGYLLSSGGEALIIDPPRCFGPYLDALEESGCRLAAVADTHVHADYISGGPVLSRLKRVPYFLHPGDAVSPYDGARGRTEFSPLEDGDAIGFGRAAVAALHTPGHTEGSMTYTLDDEAAFTGDFLFVDSIGRPDLGGKTKEWAILLWKSTREVRRRVGPACMVYPAHYSSEAERRSGRSVGAALGEVLRQNELLQIVDEAGFLAWVEAREAPVPEAYRKIKAVNIGLAEVTDDEAGELEAGKNLCALGAQTP